MPIDERRRFDDLPDQTHDAIRALIMETDAPKDKAVLLILLRISEGLEKNTELTRGLEAAVTANSKSFTTHEANEAAMLGKARTAWWVFTGMLGFVSILAAVLLKIYTDDFKVVQTDVATLKHDVGLIQERHRIEDEILKGRAK